MMNQQRCDDWIKSIVQRMEDRLSGHVKRCPKCEELLDMMEYSVDYEPEEGDEKITCGVCGNVDHWEEFDTDLVDYLKDNYGVEFRSNERREYQSVSVFLAVGGPTIEVDTGKGAAFLYWGSWESRVPLGYELSNEIDDIFEEYFYL